MLSLLYGPTLKSVKKNQSFDSGTFVSKVISLFFNTLSKFVIAFLPRNKHLLISRLHLEFKKIKSVTVCVVSPSICHEAMKQDAIHHLIFWMLSFKPVFF